MRTASTLFLVYVLYCACFFPPPSLSLFLGGLESVCTYWNEGRGEREDVEREGKRRREESPFNQGLICNRRHDSKEKGERIFLSPRCGAGRRGRQIQMLFFFSLHSPFIFAATMMQKLVCCFCFQNRLPKFFRGENPFAFVFAQHPIGTH